MEVLREALNGSARGRTHLVSEKAIEMLAVLIMDIVKKNK